MPTAEPRFTGLTNSALAIATGVCQIRIRSKSGRIDEAGTGFFYQSTGPPFIVTAKHVLRSSTTDPSEDSRPVSVSIRLKTSLSDLSKARDVEIPLWKNDVPQFRWSNEPVDLAAIRLPATGIDDLQVFIYRSENVPPSNAYLPPGTDVLLVGYPRGLHDEAHNLPLIRSGSLSSFYGINFNDRPVFKVDSDLQEGMSGAPVLLKPTNQLFKTDGSFRMMVSPVSYLLGIHTSGFDELRIHEAYYPTLLDQLTIKDR